MERDEEFILNRYAASELAGALLLGKMARQAEDPYLRNKLTWHCAEEARHAAVWEDLIYELEITSMPVHDTKKTGYFSYFTQVDSMIEFLSFVHVYELRVPFHFAMHQKWTADPRVEEVLAQLIKEEASHLSWIRDYLLDTLKTEPEVVKDALKKFDNIEKTTYQEDIEQLSKLSLGGAQFAAIIKESLPHYKGISSDNAFF